MKYPKLAFLTLPYSRLELPGWGKLLKKAGVFDDQLWKYAPNRTIRGKWHDYLMTLELSNWSERQTYFLARYYDLSTQLFIRKTVKPGDTFIDIGANIGMIALLAASCVGKEGKVYAFEPNPEAYKKLRNNIVTNNIEQLNSYRCGLGEKETVLTLTVVTEHTGMGTMGQIPEKDLSLISNCYQVPVHRGDDVLPKILSESTFIKIDVEGFEPYVIAGLPSTISELKPTIVMEIIPEYLERAKSSMKEVCNMMVSYGYEGFLLGSKRVGIHHSLKLQKVSSYENMKGNYVWIHSNSNILNRLTKEELS